MVVVVPGRKKGSAPPAAGDPPLVPKHMRSIIQMSYGAMKRSIGVIDAYLYERIHWQPDLWNGKKLSQKESSITS